MIGIPRVRRIPADAELRSATSLRGPDYSDSFAVSCPATDTEPAEAWMRTVLEHAPRPVRWFLVAGWRLVLGFRPGPWRRSTHLLGWPVLSSTPEVVVLEQHSGLMSAQLVLRAAEDQLAWATFVRYERRAAPAVWAAVGLLHRRIVPYLLRRAVRRSPGAP